MREGRETDTEAPDEYPGPLPSLEIVAERRLERRSRLEVPGSDRVRSVLASWAELDDALVVLITFASPAPAHAPVQLPPADVQPAADQPARDIVLGVPDALDVVTPKEHVAEILPHL